jgi:excinuclease ABC subunit C
MYNFPLREMRVEGIDSRCQMVIKKYHNANSISNLSKFAIHPSFYIIDGTMLPNKKEHIAEILGKLPSSPGVYQMKDITGKVIYVGKSVNLKSRVSSYFRDTGTLTLAKKQMVSKITDIEILLCGTEVEALVLETNLIKHLSPKYNILMKDDKNLAYIKITNSPVPEVIKTRNKTQD